MVGHNHKRQRFDMPVNVLPGERANDTAPVPEVREDRHSLVSRACNVVNPVLL